MRSATAIYRRPFACSSWNSITTRLQRRQRVARRRARLALLKRHWEGQRPGTASPSSQRRQNPLLDCLGKSLQNLLAALHCNVDHHQKHQNHQHTRKSISLPEVVERTILSLRGGSKKCSLWTFCPEPHPEALL